MIINELFKGLFNTAPQFCLKSSIPVIVLLYYDLLEQ